jgi:alkylhydroperoxidase family enzyme
MATNFEQAFAERPDVFAAWQGLNKSIKSNMDLRRYELATVAAAQQLRSSYCCLMHGMVLREECGADVAAVMRDPHSDAAGLDAVDHAVMQLARRVASGDASDMGDADLQPLRDLGLSDAEVMDVVLAAAARCFFSTALDALGVRPDARFNDLDDDLRGALEVGRRIADPVRA